MSHDQNELLRNYKDDIEGNLLFSIVNGSHQGNFKIKDSKFTYFFKDYCNLVRNCADCNISEVLRFEQEIPLVATFIFKYPDSHGDGEWYSDGFVFNLVAIFQLCINDFFELETNASELFCFYMESEPYHENGETSICARIQFPYCRMKYSFYEKKFMPTIIKKLSSYDFSDFIIPQFAINWKTSYVSFNQSGKIVIPLYGSKMFPCDNPVLRYVFTEEITPGEKDSDDLNDFSCEDVDILSDIDPLYHSVISTRKSNSDVITSSGENIVFWLPIILSCDYHSVLSKYKRELETEKPRKNANSSSVYEFRDDEIPDNSEEMFKFFIQFVSSERMRQKHTVREIAQIIFSSFRDVGKNYIYDPTLSKNKPKGIEILFSTFLKFGHTEEECIEIWNEIIPDNVQLTVKRLAEYVQEDDSNTYNSWHKKWYTLAFEKAIKEPTDDNLAEAFYRKCWLQLIFSSKENGGDWYEFNGTRLVRINKTRIKTILRIDFQNVLRDIIERLNNEGRNSSKMTEVEQTINLAKMQMVQKILNSVGKDATKKKIIESAGTFFDVPYFSNFENANNCLIGTDNCVLEVVRDGPKKYIICRKGYIEDYITYTTRVPYLPSFTENHAKVKRVREIIRQMMCYSKDMENRVRCKLSALLQGKNSEKFFSVSTGDGDNGKSIFYKLIHYALGDYYVDLPVEIITTKPKSASGPRPELMCAHGVRIAVISEHDKSLVLASLVKALTGGDTLSIRNLFQGTMKKFVQMYSLHLQTNDPPEFDDAQRSIKARVDIIPFIATFSDDAPEDLEEQKEKKIFPKNDDLEEDIKKLGSAMLWCMVKDFEMYTRTNLKKNIPKFIDDYMRSYWDENDPYTSFINECLELDIIDPRTRTRSTKGEITVKEMYVAYQIWFRAGKPNSKIPEAKNVIKCLKDPTRLGPFIKGKKIWSGMSFKEEILEKMTNKNEE